VGLKLKGKRPTKVHAVDVHVLGDNVYNVRMKGIQNQKIISRILIFIHVFGLCHRKVKHLQLFPCTAYAHAPACCG
jgi:hypothetical protein